MKPLHDVEDSSSSDVMQVGTAIQVRTAMKKQIHEAEMGSTASALDFASETSATDSHSVEDLFKIATLDYRSNDDCILSPPTRRPSLLHLQAHC